MDSGIQLEREKACVYQTAGECDPGYQSLLTRELRKELEKIFVQDRRYQNLFITVLSFDSSTESRRMRIWCLSVFLPNPYYVKAGSQAPDRGGGSGLCALGRGTADRFLSMLYEMLDFLIPNYVQEGKNQLVIAMAVQAASTAPSLWPIRCTSI